MASLFADPRGYEYEEGKFLLGMTRLEDEGGKQYTYPIGVKTNRHAVTFAGSGSGKGVGVICNNLMLWPHNALVIDPKGEAAEITAQKRTEMGQKVYVVDPYGEAKIDDDLRASFNPLAQLDPNDPNIVEDIEIIVDGLVIRSDPSSAYWDNGGAALLAGLIAFILLDAPAEHKNLIKLREILRDKTELDDCLEHMKDTPECGGLCQAAYSAATAEEGKYFISNAQSNTRWLDSQPMENALKTSSFELNELKRGNCSVYLVLPLNYLNVRGQFLRLFVRCAMNEMARRMPNGDLKGSRCLFFLDEFFSLGKIDEIPKGFGTMRAYGLQLWPILQDLPQLIKLYGHESAQTFFSNSDIHQYFGNTDLDTINHVSGRFGVEGMEDMPDFHHEDDPIFDDLLKTSMFTNENQFKQDMALKQKWRNDAKQNYDMMVSRRLGKPRLPPDRTAEMIAPQVDEWAKGSFVFTPSSKQPLYLALLPWFYLDAKGAFLWNQKIPAGENQKIFGGATKNSRPINDTPHSLNQRHQQSNRNDGGIDPNLFWVAVSIIVMILVYLFG